MTIDFLTTFFGWIAVINIAYLALATLVLTLMRGWVTNMHTRIFGLDGSELKLAYFNWVGQYKIMALIFSVVPYIALRLA